MDRYEQPYKVIFGCLGTVKITRQADGASVYLQGDDASEFGRDWDFLGDHIQEVYCRAYDELLDADAEDRGL